MILEEFFNFYLAHTTPCVRKRITALLPSNLEKSAQGLASMFKRSDVEAFEFQMAFYKAMAEIRQNDSVHCIMFDDSNNICYPFLLNMSGTAYPSRLKTRPVPFELPN